MGREGSWLELTTGVVFNILLAPLWRRGKSYYHSRRILLFLAADWRDL